MRSKDFTKICEITGERNFHGRVLQSLTGKPFMTSPLDKKQKVKYLRKEVEFIGNAIKWYRLLDKEHNLGICYDEGKYIAENYERVRKALPENVRNGYFREREVQYMSNIRKVLVNVMHGKEVEEIKRTELINLVGNMEKSAESDLSKLVYESKKNSFPFSKREASCNAII